MSGTHSLDLLKFFQFHSGCSTLFNAEYKNQLYYNLQTLDDHYVKARRRSPASPFSKAHISCNPYPQSQLQQCYFIFQPSALHPQNKPCGITDIFGLFASARIVIQPKSAALTPSLFNLSSLKALRWGDLVRLHERIDSNMMNLRQWRWAT